MWITRLLAAFLGLCAALAVPVRADDTIEAVLHRSHGQRLAAMPVVEAEGERAAVVRRSFEQLVAVANLPRPVELRVISGAIVAETLQGAVVVANERLADLNEAERRFILAHELAHVSLGHWAQLGALYRRWIPGAVRQEETDPIAGALGREASVLAHQHEFEADAHGLAMLRRLGGSLEDAAGAFVKLGAHATTATHPGSRQRLAALRSADDEARLGRLAAIGAEAAGR